MSRMLISSDSLLNVPAPAKINLFLHITGRRADGYHLLQTVFRLIDWADELDFIRRDDHQINFHCDNAELAGDDNLVVRAARLLRSHTSLPVGVDIVLRKRLPAGAGLGGGSSDAATTLIALNRLWQLGLSRGRLQQLGLTLGADVPFFIFGRDAFAQGIGEQLQEIGGSTLLAPTAYLLLTPDVHISTAVIFKDENLTRDTSAVTIADFSESGRLQTLHNDLQPVVLQRYPIVGEALSMLAAGAKEIGMTNAEAARMTGSGSGVFLPLLDEDLNSGRVAALLSHCRQKWQAHLVHPQACHPLIDWLES